MPQNMQRSWKHHSSTGRTCGKSMKIMQFFLVLKMISAGLNLLKQLFRWNPNRNQIGPQKTPRPHPIPTTHECHVHNKQK